MNKNLKMLCTLILSGQFLASCSSTYQAPESFDQKMGRYQAQTYSKNQTPQLPSFAPKKSTNTRAPASVEPIEQRPQIQPKQKFVQSHSPKRLYFLTLYTQFQKLASFKQRNSAKTPDVCPHFHSTLVEHNQYFDKKADHSAQPNQNYTKKLIQSIKENPQKLAYYPELALPVHADSLRPRVIDLVDHEAHLYTPMMAQKMVDQALAVHLSKTQSELVELCEFGSSDNYYTYENLVGRVKREGAYDSNPLGAQTMLKTTLVFNQALIDSLKSAANPTTPSRSPASDSPAVDSQELYHQEALKQLKADWMQSYLSELTNR